MSTSSSTNSCCLNELKLIRSSGKAIFSLLSHFMIVWISRSSLEACLIFSLLVFSVFSQLVNDSCQTANSSWGLVVFSNDAPSFSEILEAASAMLSLPATCSKSTFETKEPTFGSCQNSLSVVRFQGFVLCHEHQCFTVWSQGEMSSQ